MEDKELRDINGQYKALQDIYLDWHDGKRPLSGFINAIIRHVQAARIDELTEFEPLMRDHTKCLDYRTCIGYQNAASDFDNEKEIRLVELKAARPSPAQTTPDENMPTSGELPASETQS